MNADRTEPRDPRVETVEDLERCLREAEASGEPVEMTDARWRELYSQVEEDALLRRKAS